MRLIGSAWRMASRTPPPTANDFSEIVKQCSGLARGSRSPIFMPLLTGTWGWIRPAQHPSKLGLHRDVAHHGDRFTGLGNLPNGLLWHDEAIPRCVEHPPRRHPADLAGRAGIRLGRTLPQGTPQGMPAVGFDHHVAVHPGFVARSQPNHQRRILKPGAGIVFQHPGIHHDSRRIRPDGRAGLVHKYRNLTRVDQGLRVRQRRDPARRETFDRGLPIQDGHAEAHRTPHAQGLSALRNQDQKPGLHEPVDHARTEIAAAAHQHRSIPKQQCQCHAPVTARRPVPASAEYRRTRSQSHPSRPP